ncbi:toprim domain-containing protein [bacterium]|nr:toprim domain-containing protein [bacterium]
MRDIKEECRNRWFGILSSLGISVGENGRHGPCPICRGGKDRFRWDNKDGSGSWICNQCGSGDGIALVMKVLNLDFKEAVKEVRKIVGTCDVSKQQAEPKVSKELLRKIYIESRPMSSVDPVGKYLVSRGITIKSDKLRYHPECYEPETHSKMPAMLATFTLPDSTAITMHRTFITLDGQKANIENPKKLLPALQEMSGGAIRLFDPDEGMIGVAEGIETALAVTEMTKIPCWSVVSSALMANFQPPKGIKHVMIFGDNDRNYTGQKAAFTLANRLIIGNSATVEVCISKAGDFLDDLKR